MRNDILEIVDSMSLEEKVSQMFLVSYPSGEETFTSPAPAGYIMFERHFKNETPASIKEKLSKLQKESKIPLLIGVDEEGGSVCRISNNPVFRKEKFKAPRKLGSIAEIAEDAETKSYFLKNLGINMNLAPVLDMPRNPGSYMFERSYSCSVTETAYYARVLISVYGENDLVSCAKHFPGYGDAVDTHTGNSIDKKNRYELERDMIPFQAAVEEEIPCIMVNHNIIKCLDNVPATLSKKVHVILRNELGFKGIIVTDDMSMKAVLKGYDRPVIQAIKAGNDLIITGMRYYKKQKEQVLKAIQNGEILEADINESVKRILTCKLIYGIIE